MKYNMAPPTPRLGLTKRNTYASLHTKAHDRHTGPCTPPKDSDDHLENEDVNRPPEDSDQDSDVASNTDISVPENDKTASTMKTPGSLDNDTAKSFIQKPKAKAAVTYGKAKRTGSSRAVQKARPPKYKAALAIGFTRPPEADISKGLLQKLGVAQGFNHDIVPSKASETKINAKFEEFHHPSTEDMGSLQKANGSTTLLASENRAFIAPQPGVSQPIISSQLSDLNDDIDEIDRFLKQRANKKGSQHSVRNDTDGGRPAKKRRITPEPEPEFVAPPPPLSSLNTDGLSSGIPLDLEDDQLPYDDTLGNPSSSVLTDSLTNTQRSACPMCLAPIEQANIDEFMKQHKLSSIAYLSTRKQDSLHKFHAELDARSVWQERHYPDIDWTSFTQRLTQHKAHLLSIMDGTQPSHLVKRIKQSLSRRGRRTATLADERRAGESSAQDLGYYGTRGQRAVGDWLLREFSAHLRQQAPHDATIQMAGNVGGYIAKVLVPEVILQLIKQDLWDRTEMLAVLQARIYDLTSEELDVDSTTLEDRDLRRLLESAAQELGTPLSEMHCADTHWLARFAAADSAQCGLLLSEELEDVVRVDNEEQDAV